MRVTFIDKFGDWGLGIWGLGFGPQPPIPNPQSPIPNPQGQYNNCQDKFNLNINIIEIILCKIKVFNIDFVPI